MFYTYIYQRRDGTPYYVGKGKGRRAFSGSKRSVSVPERSRIVIQQWASEDEAFEMERWWISFFGRKDIKTGILRNYTDGGDGQRGFSDELKQRISDSLKGRGPSSEHMQMLAQHNKGNTHTLGLRFKRAPFSATHRKKLSDAKKGRILSLVTRQRMTAAHFNRKQRERERLCLSTPGS